MFRNPHVRCILERNRVRLNKPTGLTTPVSVKIEPSFNLYKNSTDYFTSTQGESFYSTTDSISHSTIPESSTTSSEHIVSETSITILNNDITSKTTSSDTITKEPTTQESVSPAITTVGATEKMNVLTEVASTETTSLEKLTTSAAVSSTTEVNPIISEDLK